METFKHTHRVYYHETDKMKRVYHSNFLHWMEEARTELLRSLGLNYKEMEENNIFLPITEINVKYFKPVEYDELVNIYITITEISKIRVRFRFVFFNYNDTVKFAEGSCVNVFMDESGKILKMKSDILEKIGRYKSF